MACERACGSATGCARGVRCGARPSSRVRARAPPVRHIIRGGYKRGLHDFKVGKGIMDPLVHLRNKRAAGGSNCRRVSPRDAALGQRNAEVVSQSPEQSEKDDGGDRGRVRGVWPHPIGGQN